MSNSMTGHINDVQIPDLDTPYSIFSNTNISELVVGQEKSIRAIITERQQQLDAVLHDISDLDTVMDKIMNLRQHLMEKQDKITQSMTLHKGLVSALWRLPAEVLSQIFVYCLPEFDYLDVSSERAPMLLTRICRRWRETALDTSSVWCRLFVDVRSRQPLGYDSWLKRSRGRSLSLSLRYYEGDETIIRNLLQPYLTQISSIVFPNTKAYRFLSLDLPTLQELTIENTSRDSPSDAESISQLPLSLRSLVLQGRHGFNFQQSCSSSPIWAHLTHLEICASSSYTFLRLLELCLNLSSATVNLPSMHDNIILPFLEPFTHTKLRSLIIGCSEWVTPNTLPDLFNALSLPNLHVFDAYHVEARWPHEEFKAFLARSNRPLERLMFSRGVVTDEQKAEYIALIPSLTVLLTLID